MATQKFKAPLNTAQFPFLYSRASRAVLQPGLDVAQRTPQQFFGAMANVDYNVIQLLYCENVLPTATGLFSVGVDEEIAAVSPAVSDFDRLIILRDPEENNVMFSPGRGKNYVYNPGLPGWESKNAFTPGASSKLVTKAYVNGRTFVCYEYERVIEWDATLALFHTRTLNLPAGYTMADIRGVCGASNYLLAFTNSEILWSSLTDLLDFDDPDTGSGRQTPIDLKGPINAVEPIAGGYIIYTSRNAVAAAYTNDATRPFIFSEVRGSGGVASSDQVTSDANSAGHYSYGSSGVQLLDLQRAETTFPELADFLVSREYEYWDSVDGKVSNIAAPVIQQSKMVYLANRYLFVSYGWQTDRYTFALVYDTALKRWGKVRADHIDVGLLPLEAGGGSLRYYELDTYDSYELVAYEDLVEAYGPVPPLKEGFIFLEPSGRVQMLTANAVSENSYGVAVFGHIQVTRGRNVTFQQAEIDGLFIVPSPKLRILPAENGYDREPAVDAEVVSQTAKYVKYEKRHTSENFDIAVEGRFDASTLVVETTIHGSR